MRGWHEPRPGGTDRQPWRSAHSRGHSRQGPAVCLPGPPPGRIPPGRGRTPRRLRRRPLPVGRQARRRVMTRVDLDELEKQAMAQMGDADYAPSVGPQKVLALVAELRAAREVVKQARPYVGLPLPEGMTYPPLAVALIAYDEAVGS